MLAATDLDFGWEEAGDVLDGMYFPLDLLGPPDDATEFSHPSRSGSNQLIKDEFGVDPAAVSAPPPPPRFPESADARSKGSMSTGSTVSSGTSMSGKSKLNPRSQSTSEEGAANSAACRRYRNKRRVEVQTLRDRNAELEDARNDYLSRIAELQMDLQTERAGGHVDLAKENEMLRAEIRKHKAFVHNIVSATRDVPDVLPEERARLLRIGMDSGIGQITGLLYTSANWRRAASAEVAPGRRVHVLYQLLPEGCTAATAKRINLRTDFGPLPCAAQTMHERTWRLYSDAEAMTTSADVLYRADGVQRAYDVLMPELVGELASELEMDMALLRYTERDGPRLKESVLAISSAARHLSPRSFLFAPFKRGPDATHDALDAAAADDMTRDLEAELGSGPVPCHVICAASCAESLAAADVLPAPQAEAQRLAQSMIKGQVVVPHSSDPGRCYLSTLSSIPMGFFSGLLSCQNLVGDDGVLTDTAQGMFAAAWAHHIAPIIEQQ